MNSKCQRSGRIIADKDKHKPISYDRRPCDGCGKMLKPRFAGGGYEGYASYWYWPSHNKLD